MPVPQSDTATTVVSADTNDVVRAGIEGPSVRTCGGLVKPRPRDGVESALAASAPAQYSPGLDAERTRERRACIRNDHCVREARCLHAQLARPSASRRRRSSSEAPGGDVFRPKGAAPWATGSGSSTTLDASAAHAASASSPICRGARRARCSTALWPGSQRSAIEAPGPPTASPGTAPASCSR